MVQVSIMEEAGQDVPNWLRGEADRFKNHQVDITIALRLTILLARVESNGRHTGSTDGRRSWRCSWRWSWKIKWHWVL